MSAAVVSLHRGPGKDGKKQLSVFLTTEEYEALCKAAEANFRSAPQQARAIIVAAIMPKEGA